MPNPDVQSRETPRPGERWCSKSGREWRTSASKRPGCVRMYPLDAHGFGGVKARDVEIDGLHRRGWKKVADAH